MSAVMKKRPKHLNVFLLGLQLPFPGLLSIFHRITGAGLFLMFWLILWLFDKSLASEADYQEVISWLRHPIVLLIGLGLLWAFIFHFCMGIRYLILDADIAVDLKSARLTSFLVAIASTGISAIVFAWVLYSLFPELRGDAALMKKFIIGAHYGMRDWIFQRVTAAYMAFYTVVFILTVAYFGIGSFNAWHDLFAFGPMKFLTFIFFMAALYHAWVGMRDIYMDYVKPMWIKLPLMSITILVLIGYAGWVAQILWRL